jgi:hypothetical protein
MALMDAARTMHGPATPLAERRSGRRFEIALDLRWKLLAGERGKDSGTGRTIEVSSSGLSFEAGRPLPAGANLELSITWPVLLRNVAQLQLKVIGEVVRSGNGCAAVRMRHHEFRTVALTNRRSSPLATSGDARGATPSKL